MSEERSGGAEGKIPSLDDIFMSHAPHVKGWGALWYPMTILLVFSLFLHFTFLQYNSVLWGEISRCAYLLERL